MVNNNKDLPGKMMALQLKDPTLLYNCYMPFLEHGGLFVPTEDVFSLGEDILLAVEIADYPKRFLPTTAVWPHPARTPAPARKVSDWHFPNTKAAFRRKP